MAAFRRCILALALFASFAILASAQNIVPMACSVTPFSNTMRAEGKNELIGDLVLSCTGGNPLTNGTAAPRVDFTMTLPQAITSRQVTTGTAPFASDALLLIDDPNPAAPAIAGAPAGFGNNAVPVACTDNTSAVATSCPAFVETTAGFTVMSDTAVNPPTTGAPNEYQGYVNGNTVKFTGVPVVVPGSTSGVARTFRITNVRMNATAATAGPQTVSVTITSTSGQTGNPAGLFGSAASISGLTLGTVATGLSATGTKWTAASPGLTTCAAITAQYAGTISFAEGFGSAFKVRQTPAATAYSGQDAALTPNTTPQTFQTESGYTPTTGTGFPGQASLLSVGGKAAGEADFGTRLKAVFTNIPSGARVFVSFTNVEKATSTNIGIQNSNFFTGGALDPNNPGSSATTSFAELISGTETTADATGGIASVPTATPSTTAVGSIYANFGYNELTVSSTGSATAIWEVMNTNSTANETFTFSVFVTEAAQGSTGTATVNLSLAPNGATATTIPTFADTSGAGVSSIAITSCRTILLFPFVTSAAGFDTGLAVANTTQDILGTTGQTGTCSLYVYGVTVATDTAPTNNGPFPPFDGGGKQFAAAGVPSGQVAEWLVSQAAPGFTGYAIATCNFQYAHGFAFVYSPVLSAAMGYLPLVLPSPVTRGASPEVTFP